MSTLHISREFADLLKRYGEERLMRIVEVWEKRNTWQRERYHRKIKPGNQKAREEMSALRQAQRESELSSGGIEAEVNP